MAKFGFNSIILKSIQRFSWPENDYYARFKMLIDIVLNKDQNFYPKRKYPGFEWPKRKGLNFIKKIG